MIGKILLHTGKNLMGLGVEIRIERFFFQPQLSAWLAIGTQPCYKAPGDLRVKIAETQWLTSSEWGCPPNNDPKMALEQPNRSLKNSSKVKCWQRCSVYSKFSWDLEKFWFNIGNLIINWAPLCPTNIASQKDYSHNLTKYMKWGAHKKFQFTNCLVIRE